MTSFERVSPLATIASAKEPISSQLIADATAKTKDPARAALQARRELREIIDTKVLGDKTPEVTPELAAELTKIEAIAKLRPLNNLAAEMFTRRVDVPQSAIVPSPHVAMGSHAIQAMVLGARAAMEGQLATDTDEQKASKEGVLKLLGETASSAQVSFLLSAWASFAKPVAPGKFTVPNELIPDIASGMKAMQQAMNALTPEALKIALGSIANRLQGLPGLPGALGAEEGGPAAPKMTLEQLQAKKKALEESLKRPVGGLDQDKLEELYGKLNVASRAGEFVYGVRKARPAWYREVVNVVRAHPVTMQLEPIIHRILGNIAAQQREVETTFAGREINKELLAGNTDKQLEKLYFAAREVADALGAGPDLSLLRTPSLTPNAYVYMANFDAPRVVVHDAFVRMCWDSEARDFIKIGIKDGKAVPANTPGAEIIPIGKLVFQDVVGHELGHIRDGIPFTRIALGVLTGNMMRSAPKTEKVTDHAHSAGCQCGLQAETAGFDDLMSKVMADPSIQAFLPTGGASDKVEVIEERLIDLLGAKLMKETAGGASGLFSQLTREAEATADQLSTMHRGTGKHLAMFFDIIRRASDAGTPQEREDLMIESFNRDLVAELKAAMLRSQKSAFNGQAMLGSSSSHPPEAFRAIGNAQFADTLPAKTASVYRALPPQFRSVAAAVAIDAGIERQEDVMAAFSSSMSAHTDKVFESVVSEARHEELSKRLSIVTGALAELAIRDGVRLKEGEPDGFIFEIIQFIRSIAGQLFAQHAEPGDSDLLADVEPMRPAQGVNTYEQLAVNLAKHVSETGEQMPAEERKLWLTAIGMLKKGAAEGEKQLDESRQEAKARTAKAVMSGRARGR